MSGFQRESGTQILETTSARRVSGALMGTDIFYYHSYSELLLSGKWVKATPAFDKGLCDRFGVRTLEFDGSEDSLMHPYNDRGRRHMEYLCDRGPRADVPVRDIMETFAREYPRFGSEAANAAATRFREEAPKERRKLQERPLSDSIY